MNVVQKVIKYVANRVGLMVSGVSEPEKWLIDLIGGTKSKSGVAINEKTAVKVIAVFACLRLISEQMACLPIPVYKFVPEGKKKAYEHPNYNMLNYEPNPYTTAFDFWQMMLVNMMLLGRGIAEIERDPRTKQPIALWPMPANRVKVYVNKQTHEPYYDIHQLDGTIDRLYSDQVLDIKGMGLEELNAYDPVVIARECLGLSLAAEEFAGEYFANGVHPSGLMTYAEKLKGDSLEEFKKEVREAYSGLGNKHRLMLLESGMTFQKLTTPANEAQMLETRQHQVVEVARFFNVPPHKIMDMSHATFSNIEELNISFAQDTLVPYCTRIEQNVQLKMFFQSEKSKFFVKYNLGALLRGKLSERYESYAHGRQWGWLSANDVRALEDQNGIGEKGDIYLQPLNMVPAGTDISTWKKKGGTTP